MQEVPERFVDRTHLIPAGWALATGLVTTLVGVWVGQAYSSGPQEVVVTNPVDTVVVSGRSDLDNELGAEEVESIMRRLLTDRPARETPSPQGAGAPSAPDLRPPPPVGEGEANPVQIPTYRLPSNVGGWTQRPLSAFARSVCPESTVGRGEVITVSFDLFGSSLVGEATPIFVRLNETRVGEVAQQRFEQQYQLRPGVNTVRLAGDFAPGAYELAVGFYLERELGQEYPPYYARRCLFRVV